MLAGTGWCCGEGGTEGGIPVLGIPAPFPRAFASLIPPLQCQRSPMCQQQVPLRGRGSPCVVVDGGGQGVPGAPRQDAQRLLHGVLPVRPLHEPVHHLRGPRELVAPRAMRGPRRPLRSSGGAEPAVSPSRAGPRPWPPRFAPSWVSSLLCRSLPASVSQSWLLSQASLSSRLCAHPRGMPRGAPLTSYSSPSPAMTTNVSHCDRSSSRTFS